MRLTVLGGGGFRVPLVYRAVAANPDRAVDELVLHDPDPHRLRLMEAVLEGLARRGGAGPPPRSARPEVPGCA